MLHARFIMEWWRKIAFASHLCTLLASLQTGGLQHWGETSAQDSYLCMDTHTVTFSSNSACHCLEISYCGVWMWLCSLPRTLTTHIVTEYKESLFVVFWYQDMLDFCQQVLWHIAGIVVFVDDCNYISRLLLRDTFVVKLERLQRANQSTAVIIAGNKDNSYLTSCTCAMATRAAAISQVIHVHSYDYHYTFHGNHCSSLT